MLEHECRGDELQDFRLDVPAVPVGDAGTWRAQPYVDARLGRGLVAGVEPNGQLDLGMIFICFNADPDRQFVAVQKLLIDEPLVDYISPFGGGYFFALPGAQNADDWPARSMLDGSAKALEREPTR